MKKRSKKAKPVKAWATISFDRYMAMQDVCNASRKIQLALPRTIEQIELRKSLLWLDELENGK